MGASRIWSFGISIRLEAKSPSLSRLFKYIQSVSVPKYPKSEILVQAYSFSSAPIANALVDAKKRGVNVVAVLDKSQRREKYTAADFLAHAGIPTFIDASHAVLLSSHQVMRESNELKRWCVVI